jgi:hypothetical protein
VIRLLAIPLLLMLGACQTPGPLPSVTVANSATRPTGPISLIRALKIVPPNDADALRANFLELFILRQELPFAQGLVLLRRQERGIWRQRVEARQAGVRDLMPISRGYQAAIAERDRLISERDALHRRIAEMLKRPAATLELDFRGLVRDADSLEIELESLVHMAQTHRPGEDEVSIAQSVRDSFQSLAETTGMLAEFAGDTHDLMRGLKQDLQALSNRPETVPDDLVEARIQVFSSRIHGLELLRSQQQAVLALEAAIGEPLWLSTFPDLH